MKRCQAFPNWTDSAQEDLCPKGQGPSRIMRVVGEEQEGNAHYPYQRSDHDHSTPYLSGGAVSCKAFLCQLIC